MMSYIYIGAVVSIFTGIVNLALNGWLFDDHPNKPYFWVGCAIGYVISALLWPVAVVLTIRNVIDKLRE